MEEPGELRPAMEATETMAPPAARRCGAAALAQRKTPRRLTPMTVAQSSSVMRSSAAGGMDVAVPGVPALFTR